MKHYHTTLLASRLARAQVTLLDLADAAAKQVDAEIERVWRAFLDLLKENHGHAANFHRALALFSTLRDTIPNAIAVSLGRCYLFARRSASEEATRTLPLWLLRQLSPLPAETIEAALREDEEPKELSRGLSEITPAGIKSRQPVRRPQSPEKQRAIYQQLVFPGPRVEEVTATLAPYVAAGEWDGIGDKDQRIPADLANAFAMGMSQGKTQQEIARDLLPYFNDDRVRARRFARTFSMLVAHQGRIDAVEKISPIGYQIHATRDSRTRPEHAARDGTVYYREPTEGQKGFGEMPRPPLEADGRPAWNCRCWLSPVLLPLDRIIKDPAKAAVFTNAAGSLVPDPVDYSSWFNAADERQRKQAIGPRRYDAVADSIDREPVYADFIHPTEGKLLSADHLEDETAAELAARRAEVDVLLARRQEQIRQIATFGFELPGQTPGPVPAGSILPPPTLATAMPSPDIPDRRLAPVAPLLAPAALQDEDIVRSLSLSLASWLRKIKKRRAG